MLVIDRFVLAALTARVRAALGQSAIGHQSATNLCLKTLGLKAGGHAGAAILAERPLLVDMPPQACAFMGGAGISTQLARLSLWATEKHAHGLPGQDMLLVPPTEHRVVSFYRMPSRAVAYGLTWTACALTNGLADTSINLLRMNMHAKLVIAVQGEGTPASSLSSLSLSPDVQEDAWEGMGDRFIMGLEHHGLPVLNRTAMAGVFRSSLERSAMVPENRLSQHYDQVFYMNPNGIDVLNGSSRVMLLAVEFVDKLAEGGHLFLDDAGVVGQIAPGMLSGVRGSMTSEVAAKAFILPPAERRLVYRNLECASHMGSNWVRGLHSLRVAATKEAGAEVLALWLGAVARRLADNMSISEALDGFVPAPEASLLAAFVDRWPTPPKYEDRETVTKVMNAVAGLTRLSCATRMGGRAAFLRYMSGCMCAGMQIPKAISQASALDWSCMDDHEGYVSSLSLMCLGDINQGLSFEDISRDKFPFREWSLFISTWEYYDVAFTSVADMLENLILHDLGLPTLHRDWNSPIPG